MQRSIFIGYDPREAEAFAVCRTSVRKCAPGIPIYALVLDDLRADGLYRRPTSLKDGRLWDDISDAPMSTEFAVSRFLVPELAQGGWALFMDCDILARAPLADLFAQCDPKYAVMCVKHQHDPVAAAKMDGQEQTRYARKNWSSVMVFNADHPANRGLTLEMVNTVPGRDLHRFCWLEDNQIGELGPEWNYLVGHSKLEGSAEPSLVHWTSGGPWLAAYRDTEFAEDYRAARSLWANEDAWNGVMATITPEVPKYLNGAGVAS